MLQRFFADRSGAVTVDWVALTAGALLVGITVVYSIFTNGFGELTGELNQAMSNMDTTISTGDAPDQDTYTQ